MIYDIRGNKEEEVTEIKFDECDDNIIKDEFCLRMFFDCDLKQYNLVKWKDFDNFIAACHKAKELWGPKE